jgi:MEDS: MEthanogen/methylotroph, DcmR Sensory domain
VMVDGRPDDGRFSRVIADIFVAAAACSTAEPARVAAWGECAPTLWMEGKAEAAIRVEQLWDELARRHHVDTLCGYSTRDLPRDEDDRVLQQIRQIHSVIR